MRSEGLVTLAGTLASIRMRMFKQAHENHGHGFHYDRRWFVSEGRDATDALVKKTMEDLEEKPVIRKIRFRRE